MRPLTASEMLDVWEAGQTVAPLGRALLLLAAAGGGSEAEAAALSIGARDGRLLRLRAACFGDTLESVAPCPACGETLELSFAASEIGAEGPEPSAGPHEVSHEGQRLAFRLPTTADLMALGDGATERALVGRCLLDGEGADALTDEAVAAIAAAMERLDPLAAVTLALDCPECGHGWEALFDIVPFFWREIEAWAERAMREVAWLAARYGWSEWEILALSAWRRQRYLELAE